MKKPRPRRLGGGSDRGTLTWFAGKGAPEPEQLRQPVFQADVGQEFASQSGSELEAIFDPSFARAPRQIPQWPRDDAPSAGPGAAPPGASDAPGPWAASVQVVGAAPALPPPAVPPALPAVPSAQPQASAAPPVYQPAVYTPEVASTPKPEPPRPTPAKAAPRDLAPRDFAAGVLAGPGAAERGAAEHELAAKVEVDGPVLATKTQVSARDVAGAQVAPPRRAGAPSTGTHPHLAEDPRAGALDGDAEAHRRPAAAPRAADYVADALAITARRDAELADKARLVLDTLKAAADSPQAVADLFTLDRFMAQLRRGAAVRAVIAGQELPYPSTGPMSLSDAVRSACSEAAETAPIAIDLRDDPALEAGPAAALAHLMAEILDHEATFSEPGRPIEVTSRPGAEGVTLVVRQWGPPPSDQELAAINALLGGDQPPGGRPPQDAATFGLEVAGLLAGRIGAGVLASAAQAPNGQSSGTIVEIRLPVALLASRQRSVPDPPPPPIQARPAVTPAGSIPVFTPARNLERPAPPASPETSALVALDQEVDAPNPPARRTSAQTGLATFDPAPAGYDGVAGEYDPTAAQAELEPMVADSSPRPMPSYRPSLRAQVNGLVTEASAAVSGGDEPSVAQTPPDATATSNEPAPAAHEAPQFDLADSSQGASGPAGPDAPTPAPFPAAAPSQPAVESSQLAPAPSQPTAAPGAPAVPNPIGAPAPSGFRAPRAGGLPLFGAAPATSAPPAAPEPPPLGPTWTPQPAPTPQTAPDPNGFAGFAPRAIYETDARGQALAELSHLATRADGDAARPRSSSRNGGKLSPEAERLRQRLAQLAPPSAPTNPPEGTPQ